MSGKILSCSILCGIAICSVSFAAPPDMSSQEVGKICISENDQNLFFSNIENHLDNAQEKKKVLRTYTQLVQKLPKDWQSIKNLDLKTQPQAQDEIRTLELKVAFAKAITDLNTDKICLDTVDKSEIRPPLISWTCTKYDNNGKNLESIKASIGPGLSVESVQVKRSNLTPSVYLEYQVLQKVTELSFADYPRVWGYLSNARMYQDQLNSAPKLLMSPPMVYYSNVDESYLISREYLNLINGGLKWLDYRYCRN
jgi:hypothetical protein